MAVPGSGFVTAFVLRSAVFCSCGPRRGDSNDRLNRGFTTDMKCDMAILAHMAVGALEYGAAGDFLALLVAFWRAQR